MGKSCLLTNSRQQMQNSNYVKKAKSSKRKAPKDEKPVKKSKVGKSESDGLKKGTYIVTNGTYVYDGTILFEDEKVKERDGYSEKIPKKNSDGVLLSSDA